MSVVIDTENCECDIPEEDGRQQAQYLIAELIRENGYDGDQIYVLPAEELE